MLGNVLADLLGKRRNDESDAIGLDLRVNADVGPGDGGGDCLEVVVLSLESAYLKLSIDLPIFPWASLTYSSIVLLPADNASDLLAL